ncbi:MAG: family 16 glycoside hydrolase, partial [Bacteroidota bacterium]
MLKQFLPLALLLAGTTLSAQITDPKATEFYEPVPPKVEATAVTTPPPSDAIVLLGKDAATSEWISTKTGGEVEWTRDGAVLTVKPGTGAIKTRRTFNDVQLHVEWRSPNEPDKEGQQRGNSGVFFQGRYEVQVLESNGSD